MSLNRLFKHLLIDQWQLRRHFPSAVLDSIEQAIQRSERLHQGEIRCVIEGALPTAALWQGQTSRDRAIEVFAQQRVWDTESNSGVLLYLLLADRAVEIVADRGVHAKVGVAQWTTICQAMQAELAQGHYQGGVLLGVEAISTQLIAHYPRADSGAKADELPNRPTLL